MKGRKWTTGLSVAGLFWTMSVVGQEYRFVLPLTGLEVPPSAAEIASDLGSIAYYKFDETSGSVAGDEIGGQDLVWIGNIADADPGWGQPDRFGGNGSYLFREDQGGTFEATISTASMDEFTFSVWIRETAVPDTPSSIYFNLFGIGDIGLSHWESDDGLHIWDESEGANRAVGILPPPGTGGWNMITLAQDAGGSTVYYNANPVLQNNSPLWTLSSTFTVIFGNANSGGSAVMEGLIDDAFIFDSRLTVAEIQTLYQAR